MKPGLASTQALLERLGDPQQSFDAILVGGTNGKGSTAATLASILTHAGRRAALFTSPHLTSFAERFVVGEARLPDDAIEKVLGEVRGHAEAVGATFFEVVTALACQLFARARAEVAVMEVGLGGRFDATNALAPVLSVITGVALDHTQVLGETVTRIAFEKAGIQRGGRPLLTGAQGEALAVIESESARRGSVLWVLDREVKFSARDRGWEGQQVSVTSALGCSEVTSPLIAAHQARNVALAVAAAQLLGVPGAAIPGGVAGTRWPGRLERIAYQGRTFLLDGAHNPDAAGALARAVAALGIAPLPVVFGASDDKDIAGMVAALRPIAGEVILTRAALSPRASDPHRLAEHFAGPTIVTRSPPEALAVALTRSRPGGVVLAAGSLYLLGELRPLLTGEDSEGGERWQ